uniref:Uncharacterized protein n=1 Tax=Dunaliella tertiolecta TaxID=3047 RepID=A0A7S3QP64_DUNTE
MSVVSVQTLSNVKQGMACTSLPCTVSCHPQTEFPSTLLAGDGKVVEHFDHLLKDLIGGRDSTDGISTTLALIMSFHRQALLNERLEAFANGLCTTKLGNMVMAIVCVQHAARW